MGDAPGREGVAQRAHHRVLADQRIERGGTILAREHLVGRVRDRGRPQIEAQFRTRIVLVLHGGRCSRWV